MGPARARRPLTVVALLIALITAAATAAPAPTCAPTDEAVSRPDFFSFRAHLQMAVARRDADAVLAVVDPHIKNTFGDDNGIEAFERRWRIRERDSELWSELGEVLALGGYFERPDTFVAPYTFRCGEDAFQDVAIIGANVRVRARPSADAPTIAALSFAVVRRLELVPDAEWTPVLLRDGRTGFVASQYVRSPVDYRAYFQKSGGRWRMTMFIAGD